MFPKARLDSLPALEHDGRMMKSLMSFSNSGHSVRWLLLSFMLGCTASLNALAEDSSAMAPLTYSLEKIIPAANWSLGSSGPRGGSRLEGKHLTLDFTQGAQSISLIFPDKTLPGIIDKIRFKARGTAKGHAIQIDAHTHFMAFHHAMGEFGGEGDQSLTIDGPPGAG
jgi:hypothetical protein